MYQKFKNQCLQNKINVWLKFVLNLELRFIKESFEFLYSLFRIKCGEGGVEN